MQSKQPLVISFINSIDKLKNDSLVVNRLSLEILRSGQTLSDITQL